MRSFPSNSNDRTFYLNQPIRSLSKKGKAAPYILKLEKAGIKTIEELLWVFPNKQIPLPPLQKIKEARIDSLFLGKGKIIGFFSKPAPAMRFKKRVPLSNLIISVQDLNSSEQIELKWFNQYPSTIEKFKKYNEIYFWGKVSEFNGRIQITSPQISETDPSLISKNIITYPSINNVEPSRVFDLIKSVPEQAWEELQEYLPDSVLSKHHFLNYRDCFKIIHGISNKTTNDEGIYEAKRRLVYHEFFLEQAKIYLRRKAVVHNTSIKLAPDPERISKLSLLFKYQLTADQQSAITDIEKDFQSGQLMNRMIQGDVGSGKTSIAIIASKMMVDQGYQAVFMCPTEALAIQQFNNYKEILNKDQNSIRLLLGSTSLKEKKLIYQQAQQGDCKILIGTHSLLNDDLKFNNLGLAIIDEQHKFGVDQRLTLSKKNGGIHVLIMTATPIPRSLRLTQFGDLDISQIKTMPSNRKEIKTKIVQPDAFPKFLNFLKTRIEMGEQAFVVVPSISESEKVQEIQNLEKVLVRFKHFFPNNKVLGLHGKLTPNEKSVIFEEFSQKRGDILISTSVVEVGINIPQATIMAILNPERFGLSSLHQLRGRVGRGHLPGFCFLILDKNLSGTSLERIKVIENCFDGFKIAESDLKIRGEGDLFGTNQSGSISNRKIADINLHEDILLKARSDFLDLSLNSPGEIAPIINKLAQNDDKIALTI